MSEGSSNPQDSNPSSDDYVKNETMSGDGTDESTHNGSSRNGVQIATNVSENPNCAEIGNSNTRRTEFISSSLDDESSQSMNTNEPSKIADPTSESPRKSILKRPNAEVIPAFDIADSSNPGIVEVGGTSKLKSPKKVTFCIPEAQDLNPKRLEFVDTFSCSKQSSQNVDAATGLNKARKDVGLCSEGMGYRLLEREIQSCAAKAKKRSFPTASVDGTEPSPERGPSPAKRCDLKILQYNPKFHEALLCSNPTLASLLDANPRRSNPADIFNQHFNMLKSEDVNMKFSANQDPSIVAGVDESSAAAGPSTNLCLQPQIDWRSLPRFIDKESELLREQINELSFQRNFWWTEFPSVPQCLQQMEDEPVAGCSRSYVSRNLLSLHKETEELVCRMRVLIDGLVKVSNEMADFLDTEERTNFEGRLRDYLVVFNDTVNRVQDLQYVLKQFEESCYKYVPCETPVLTLQGSSITISKCILSIIGSITAILGSIKYI